MNPLKWLSIATLLLLVFPALAEPLATVNGKAITQADVDRYRKDHPSVASQLPPQRILEELVRRQLLVQDAAAKKLTETPEYREKLALLEANFLADYAMRAHLEKHPVDEDRLREAYQNYLANRPAATEYRVRHIQTSDEASAAKLIEALQAGKDFSALAKKHSEDLGSARNGGNLGWLTGHMLQTFGEFVKLLKAGEFSPKPVKSEYGWHVFLVEETRESTPPTFEQAKASLAQAVENQVLLEYLQLLKQSAKIEMKGVPK